MLRWLGVGNEGHMEKDEAGGGREAWGLVLNDRLEGGVWRVETTSSGSRALDYLPAVLAQVTRLKHGKKGREEKELVGRKTQT